LRRSSARATRNGPIFGGARTAEPSVINRLNSILCHYICGLDRGNLQSRYFAIARTRFRDERTVAVEMIYRYAGVSQVEIGRMFEGLDYTAVSRERTRLRRRIEEQPALSKAVKVYKSTLHLTVDGQVLIVGFC
jgi:hypothetical protein